MKAMKIIAIYSAVCLIAGCDAFVRKFTRKPKGENIPQEEMVLAPEEYKGPNLSKEELYRQYFLFWKGWQDELVESLQQKKSQKKQLDCAEEGIKNLVNLRALLNESARYKLDGYISDLKYLKSSITKDPYGASSLNNAHTAERIRINILQKFSYEKIKEGLQ